MTVENVNNYGGISSALMKIFPPKTINDLFTNFSEQCLEDTKSLQFDFDLLLQTITMSGLASSYQIDIGEINSETPLPEIKAYQTLCATHLKYTGSILFLIPDICTRSSRCVAFSPEDELHKLYNPIVCDTYWSRGKIIFFYPPINNN